METAVLRARRHAAASPWRLAPTAVALAFGLHGLVLEPRPGDLAVHVFRAELFGVLWLGLGTVTLLATSRLPFALGTAVGLAAALALQRGPPRLAAAPKTGTCIA